MRDMRQTLSTTFRRVLRLENRRTAIRQGSLVHLPAFESAILANKREVTIYLPAGYEERKGRHYPVLYMADGQNLFEPERAFIPGQHWQVREAADHAIGERTVEPMIIVGIDNAGPQRLDEYTPVPDELKGGGGKASDYGRFLLDELKPVIDGAFRTEPERISIAGSSLGGLLTMHLALACPDVFESVAAISPSVWWAGREILNEVDAFHGGKKPRLWLDIGGREGREALSDARELRDRLRANGWELEYYEDRRADHSERAWAGRVRKVLEFLFPPVSEES
jgi:predicted alpha/beta superfamily hydrolase